MKQELESAPDSLVYKPPPSLCNSLLRIWELPQPLELREKSSGDYAMIGKVEKASGGPKGSEPKWLLGMTHQFTKDIQNVDRKSQGRVLEAISHLAEGPHDAKGDTIKPLSADLKGLWRYRIGDFRLVYQADAQSRLITLLAFASRGGIYDN